jgi:hypothetical protein
MAPPKGDGGAGDFLNALYAIAAGVQVLAIAYRAAPGGIAAVGFFANPRQKRYSALAIFPTLKPHCLRSTMKLLGYALDGFVVAALALLAFILTTYGNGEPTAARVGNPPSLILPAPHGQPAPVPNVSGLRF